MYIRMLVLAYHFPFPIIIDLGCRPQEADGLVYAYFLILVAKICGRRATGVEKTKSTLLYQFLKLVKVKKNIFVIFGRFHAFLGRSICSHFFTKFFENASKKS